MEEMFSFLTKAMEEKDWDKLKGLLDDLILIINSDTGGQAEFLDLYASLVSGPSLNLLFSRLVDNVDSIFKMYYTNEEGVSTEKEDSTMTVEEVLFTALASIACFGGSFLSPSTGKVKGSKIFLVGTFRDKVTEEQLREKDDFLRKLIENTEFYKHDMIEFASEDHLIMAVNNFSGGQEEIDWIRKRLVRAIEDNFEKVEVPVAWLILSLCLRSSKSRTMSLEQCQRLAAKLNIDEEELPKALWFLHHIVGLLLYYPELEELKGTVIVDIQVVFDSASNLIRNTFTFEKVGQRACKQFKETGLFTQKDLKKAMSKQTDDLIPLEKLVKLLEHLCILTPFSQPASSSASSQPELTYFMPCVLQNAQRSELAVAGGESDPAPLMLRYECGYVPVGVFPAMITNLVSQQRRGWGLIVEGLRKNRVQFNVGTESDIVTLISHPRYFEFVVTRSEGFQRSNESLCSEVLKVVESSLFSVTSRMNSSFCMGYKFGFECPAHPAARDHLCVLAEKTSQRMVCLQDPKKPKCSFRLEPHQRVWFSKQNMATASQDFVVSMTEVLSEGDSIGPDPQNPPRKKLKRQCHFDASWMKEFEGICRSSKAISQQEFSRVHGILQRHAHKWKHIGQGLGFTADELSNIEAKPALFNTAPCSYLDAMLSDWQQWAPGDGRGSTDYATLASLKSAMRRADLGRTADEL